MKRKNKGFTLIELLAVIVILGLLMAIAIPSVTKYITQSRKKTVTTTIGNYISALTNQVNDMEYIFTATNTVYAVPIECIALERGGTNPFGKWHQASDAYWAYVLVQYDDNTSSYTYGFTFKDSAGYGLYPTTSEKLNESGSQIQTGLNLNRPTGNSITNITSKDNWTGFDIEDDTNLVVLEATREGTLGDGKTTCTLCQKGDNYNEVEENRVDTVLYFGKPYGMTVNEVNNSYIFYEDGSIKIYEDCDLIYSLPSGTVEYKDNQIILVSESTPIANISSNKKIISFFDEEDIVDYTLNQNLCVDEYANLPMLRRYNDSIAFWQYKDKIKTITFQDRINIPNNISNDHKWDVTKSKTGKVMAYITTNPSNSSYYDLYIQGDGRIYANPDSSALFSDFEYVESINNIEILDTSKVTNMVWMFYHTGYNAKTFNLNLSSFDTSKVTNMAGMFYNAGYNATTFNIDGLSSWDTSKVTDMSSVFANTGTKAASFYIGDLSNWDTSNVTDMGGMFGYAGVNATSFYIGDLSNWNTSKVTNMVCMFAQAGRNSSTFKLVGLDKWDTSNVTDMRQMFTWAGENSTTFNIGDLSKWDTSNVTDMFQMFYYAGSKASWSLDCSSWNVKKVKYYSSFNTAVTSKVKKPAFGK